MADIVTDTPESCTWCRGPLTPGRPGRARRGRARLTCSSRCRKALNRDIRASQSSNYTPGDIVTPPDAAYAEPPARRENLFARYDADDRWRSQYAAEAVRSQPLTPEEKAAIAWQKRNPGPLHPLLAQRHVDAERERQAAEAAERARHQPLAVEDPHQPSTMDSVSRRARYDRARNRPQDPHVAVLRPGPGRSGPHPWDDDNQCVDAPKGWRRGRW
jgi:hypothetical protein